MREHGFNVGGEQSGHMILSDYATTGDGLVAALQVLAVVQKHGQPVSAVCHRFEPLPQVTKNVRYRNGKPHEDAAVTLRDRERDRAPQRPGPADRAAVGHRAGDPRHRRRR